MAACHQRCCAVKLFQSSRFSPKLPQHMNPNPKQRAKPSSGPTLVCILPVSKQLIGINKPPLQLRLATSHLHIRGLYAVLHNFEPQSVQYFFCAMHDMALQLPTTALQEDSALQPATRGCSDHQSFRLEIVLLTLSRTSRFASCNMFFGSDSR